MADRFYVDARLDAGSIDLQGPEAHHLTRVSRLGPGDRVVLFNGDGKEYGAVITTASRNLVTLEIDAITMPNRELGFHLEVAAPLPKGDRAQFLVEKLTELGVTKYIPLRTSRSVVHPRESKLEKLERYVIEASKQCGRNVLMTVEASTSWEDYCRRVELPGLRSMAQIGAEKGFAGVARDQAICVGPEGDWTEEEMELGRKHGWSPVSLGSRILRVETAATYMAARIG